jgi:hypothetical protein
MQCVVFRHVQALLRYILCLSLYNILYLQNNFPRLPCFRRKIRFEINQCCIWRYAVITFCLAPGHLVLLLATAELRTGCAQCTLPHWQTAAHQHSWQAVQCAHYHTGRHSNAPSQLTGCAHYHTGRQQHTSTIDRPCTVRITTLADTATHQHSWQAVHCAHYHTGRHSITPAHRVSFLPAETWCVFPYRGPLDRHLVTRWGTVLRYSRSS